MYKRIIILIFILIFLFIFTNIYLKNSNETANSRIKNSLVSGNGTLYIKDSKIYNSFNEEFQLKGLSSHGLQWYKNLLTYDNLKYLRDKWKINVFRLALYTEENGYIANNYLKDDLIKIVDNLIALDMYVVIDWHILSDGNPMTHKEEAKLFFDEISLKYANTPNILYEICNEPNNVDWDNCIKPYAEEVIPTIRKNSPNSIIIVGTPNWSTNVDFILDSPLEYKNIAYTCHFYSGSHGNSIRKGIKKVIDNKMCVFISEWGTTDLTGNGKLYLDSTNEWIDFLNQNKISFINWSFSNKDESTAILKPIEITLPEEIDTNLTPSGEYVKKIISTI